MSIPTPEHLLTGINIEADSAIKCADEIHTEQLKPIAKAFAKNATRVRGMLSMPEITSRNLLVCGLLLWKVAKSEPVQSIFSRLLDAGKRGDSPDIPKVFSEEILPQIVNMLLTEETPDLLMKLTNREVIEKLLGGLLNIDNVREWVEGQLAGATSAAWTAFECMATDAWVTMLNTDPMSFYQNTLMVTGSGEMPIGLDSKQISVSLLAKYQFDLRNHLGTLLKPKFDLTSLKNIREAYEAALGKSPEVAGLFAGEDLNLLEICRHVIVHRAGIIDAEFSKRTRRMSFKVSEGQPLPLNGKLVSTLANAAIMAGCNLLALVDCRLTALVGGEKVSESSS
jgi:hypothetical protein